MVFEAFNLFWKYGVVIFEHIITNRFLINDNKNVRYSYYSNVGYIIKNN